MLGMTMKSVKETMERNLKDADIDMTIDQFVILKIIDTMEDVNQQVCANLLRMDKSLFLRKLDVMQERKLVARIPDANDKRRNQLVLTKQGLEKYRECEEIEQKTIKSLMAGVSKEEFKTFAKVLDVIRHNSSEQSIS